MTFLNFLRFLVMAVLVCWEAFTDPSLNSTCPCGATGTCSGGPEFECNCDTSGEELTTDTSTIIFNDRLPLCQVMMLMLFMVSMCTISDYVIDGLMCNKPHSV